MWTKIGEWFTGNIEWVISIITLITSAFTYINTKRLLHRKVKTTLYSEPEDMALAVSVTQVITEEVVTYLEKTELNKLLTAESSKNIINYQNLKSTSFSIEYRSIDGKGRVLTIKQKPRNSTVKQGGSTAMIEDDDMETVLNDFQSLLQNLKELMKQDRVRTLHLFIAAPMPFAVILGNAFRNTYGVTVYQRNKNRDGYILAMHLN